MKGLYLCSRLHRIPNYDIEYNDILAYPGITLICDALEVEYYKYDYLIATPPCNYYSRANYRRETSIVAQETKHLLPTLLERFIKSGKPFIIENVLNDSLLPHSDKCLEFNFGQHHFYTNVFFLVYDESYAVAQNKAGVCRNKRDGNYNVDLIIKLFLEVVNSLYG